MKVLYLSDIHFPDHDPQALDAVKKHALKNKYDIIIWGGDILDMSSVSSFVKFNDHLLQTEIDQANKFMKEMAGIVKPGKQFFLIGNHCQRIKKYLSSHAKELKNLRSLSLPNLLGLGDLGITFIDSECGNGRVLIDGTLFQHGTIVKKQSGATAMAQLEKCGRIASISGHSHRSSHVFKTINGKVYQAAEAGCLCKNSGYADDLDWQQAFIEVETGPIPKIYVRLIVKGKVIND